MKHPLALLAFLLALASAAPALAIDGPCGCTEWPRGGCVPTRPL